MIINQKFKKAASIESAIAVTTTAGNKFINGRNCTVQSLVGNLWVNPLATAVADNTSIKLAVGSAIDLSVSGNLSLISDVTGATAQVIIWED